MTEEAYMPVRTLSPRTQLEVVFTACLLLLQGTGELGRLGVGLVG